MSGNADNNRPIVLAVVLAIAAVPIAIFLLRGKAAETASKAIANAGGESAPGAYDISALRKVPGEWITHRELPPIKLGIPSPVALAVDETGNILVSGNKTILKLSPSGKETGRFAINAPSVAMAVSPDSLVAVLCGNKCDLVAEKNGEIQMSIPLPENAIPTSVAIDDKSAYVADAGNGAVWRYSLKTGKLLNAIGRGDKDKEIPTLIIPSPHFDVAVASDGSIWLANTGRHMLESFSPDGVFRYSWKRPANGPKGFSGCCNPSNFTITPAGLFVTAEKNIPRVKIYDQAGKFLEFVAPPTAFADNALILDIAYNPVTKQILLLDSKTKKLRRFKKKTEPDPQKKPETFESSARSR